MKKLLIILMGLVLCVGCDGKKTNNTTPENNDVDNEVNESTENTQNKGAQSEEYPNNISVFINDVEIKLNVTTIDEFIQKSGWEAEVTSSKVVLDDGTNKISLNYYSDTKEIYGISTYKNNQADDPAFDTSVTSIKFSDDYLKNITIGDTLTKELLEEKYTRDEFRILNPYDDDYLNFVYWEYNYSHLIDFKCDDSNKLINFSVKWKNK